MELVRVLANLLMRFYKGYEGEITIDEKSISSLDVISYRSHIGLVPQDVFIFSVPLETM